MTLNKEVTEVGFELPPINKEVTFDKIHSYSGRFGGVFLKTHHTDRDVAKQVGLPDVVCQGTMILNYAFEMLFNVYREYWINSSRIKVSYIKPVFPGDHITTRGSVKQRRDVDSSMQLDLDVWAENKEGEKVMVGEAVVTIT